MNLIQPLPRITPEELPTHFPSPFTHQPHALAKLAATQLQQRLAALTQHDFFAAANGKMLGVLVVRDSQDNLGYLSGFAGQLAGEWQHPGFVPPIFNVTQRQQRRQALAQQQQQLAAQRQQYLSGDYPLLQQQVQQLLAQQDQELQALKQQHQQNRQARQKQRQQRTDADQTALRALALQSQHDKFAYQQLQQHWQLQLQPLQLQLEQHQQQLCEIEQQLLQWQARQQQAELDDYQLQNFRRETIAMSALFNGVPLPGTGDCAASKLLHYAIQQSLTPIALSEFWWGVMPAGDIRHHAQHYPACRGRCRPLLEFMLQGLEHEPAPLHVNLQLSDGLQILFEDEALLVINKPHGLLSVPGNAVEDSALHRLQQRYPQATGPLLLHRLDLSTSGLLLAAKNSETHYALQQQFLQRSIQKRYVALLSKPLPQRQGEIQLPLRVDLDDRPRQVVCDQYGKPAVTRWELIAHEDNYSRVHFYPITGRTHQLRIHAAHPLGLNAPIVGDELYGQRGQRLMLHAEQLSFVHPRSGQTLTLHCPAPF